MATFSKTMTCPVCQGEGTAVYIEVGTKRQASRLQSMSCPGGCWVPGTPGGEIIAGILAASVVEG